MIKRSSSLFISLFVHTILFLALCFTWKTYNRVDKSEDKKIQFKLSSLELSEKAPKVEKIEKPKELKKVEKIEKPKEVKKPKEIEKPKKIVKEVKKPLKKEIPKKEIKAADIKPVVEPVVEPVEEKSETEKLDKVEKAAQEIVSEKKATQKEAFESQKDDSELKQKELREKYIKINVQKIAQLLRENLYYPISARRKGITGLVIVKFTLDTNAVVHNIEVVESNSDVLSRAAVKTIKQLSEKFPKPNKEIVLSIPIDYRLN